MSMPVTVSIVGLGKIGQKHASILHSIPEVTLGPLVDKDTDQANEMATALRTTAGTLEDAIDEADCLFVCTPDNTHTEIALQAIKNDINTFVEKPLATTTTETQQLQTAAVESNATHMVGHVLRFDPRYRAIRKAVTDGELGDIVSITMKRFVKRSRVRRTGVVSPPSMRLGVHDFDLLNWLFDTSVESLIAESSAGALPEEGYDIDESTSVLATLTNDAVATITMGFCLPDGHPGSIVETVAVGTDGTISVDASGTETQQWDTESGGTVDTHLWPDIQGVPDGALARQDRAFIETIRGGGSSPIPFDAGHQAVRLAEATAEALENESRITVSL